MNHFRKLYYFTTPLEILFSLCYSITTYCVVLANSVTAYYVVCIIQLLIACIIQLLYIIQPVLLNYCILYSLYYLISTYYIACIIQLLHII